MHKSKLTLFLISLACQGCASNYLSEESAGNIDNITLVTNSTFVHDVTGFTDTIDLPKNKALAENLNATIADILKAKGYKITDKYASVGRAYDDETFYVINNALESEQSPFKLQKKAGTLYSDRLTDAQLTSLRTGANNWSNVPAVSEFEFKSDALLVLFIDGRTVGFEKVVAEFVANAGISILLAATLGTNGSMVGAEGDVFHTHMRLYRIEDGALLWDSDIDRDTADVSLQGVIQKINTNFPMKKI